MLQPWASGEKADVVRLRPTEISGRRIYRPTPNHQAQGAGVSFA
jgi:hypothetical protein